MTDHAGTADNADYNDYDDYDDYDGSAYDDQGDGATEDAAGRREPPWWHSAPSGAPADSVVVEGAKLFTVLYDWAVESGATATAAQLAQALATTASEYIVGLQAGDDDEQEAVAVTGTLRCADCPVCRTLDTLDRSNPQLADSARLVIAQVGGLLAGLIGTEDSDEEPE